MIIGDYYVTHNYCIDIADYCWLLLDIVEYCSFITPLPCSQAPVVTRIQESAAWDRLVLHDPLMVDSIINVVLAYSTDGVNPFRSGQYTMWPLVFKVLNLPPSLASSTSLLILAGIIRGPKKPKSLQAYQLLIADEIEAGRRGLKSTSPDGRRTLWFRTKLILHSCDGPANGMVSNQQVAGAFWGCIKCEIQGYTSLKRVLYGQVRRYLPLGHPYRTDPSFGEEELRGPPAKRTLAGVKAAGQMAAWYKTFGQTVKDYADLTKVYYCLLLLASCLLLSLMLHYNRSIRLKLHPPQGVKGPCAFSTLASYDFVFGAMVDVVHTLKEVIKKIISMMKGKRSVKDSKTGRGREEVAEARRRAKLFSRTKLQQRRADRKYQALPVPPGSLRRGVAPFGQTGTLNINDIHRYLQRRGPGGYHLAASDLGDDELAVLIEYMGAIDILVAPETDVDGMTAKRTSWLETLARAERALPAPEGQALINHQLIEIWEQLLALGPAWAHWTYIFERFLSRLTRKITDRSGTAALANYCSLIVLLQVRNDRSRPTGRCPLP